MVDDTSPAFGMGQFTRFPGLMATVEEMPAAFRSGLGYDYDSHGEDGAAGVERSFEPWYRNYLVPVGLPSLDGVVERLEAGGTVADVGCGAGIAVLPRRAGLPGQRGPRLRHLPPRPGAGRARAGSSWACRTPTSTTPGRSRCRPTARSTS